MKTHILTVYIATYCAQLADLKKTTWPLTCHWALNVHKVWLRFKHLRRALDDHKRLVFRQTPFVQKMLPQERDVGYALAGLEQMSIGRVECTRLRNLGKDQRMNFNAHATDILDVAFTSVDQSAVLAYADERWRICRVCMGAALLDLSDCVANVRFTHRG